MSELVTQLGLRSAFGWLFFLGAAGAIAAALMMVFSRSPMRASIWFLGALSATGLLFALLDATFLAVMQVLVYAGAIIVAFVFVIMLLDTGSEASVRPATLSVAKVLGTLAAGYFAFAIVDGTSGAAPKAVDGSSKGLAEVLASDFLFAGEAIVVLLLVAVVGVVVVGLKRLA